MLCDTLCTFFFTFLNRCKVQINTFNSNIMKALSTEIKIPVNRFKPES